MKKEYEKPIVEVVVFDCVVVADISSDEATLDIGGWWL